MAIPVSAAADAVRQGIGAARESDAPVRVAVYVDATAAPSIVETVRDALVPETTSALVRVAPLDAEPALPKPDTDVVLVLSSGSDGLEERVRALVVAGAPVAVVTESSVEAPFIAQDTPLLGLVASTDAEHLLDALARWILDRTDKDAAFAANFPFMREVASARIVERSALANLATGALVFIPGADFPVMTMTQVGMALRLSGTYGYPLAPERAYEVAGVVAGGLVLRQVSRALCSAAPRLSFAVKGIVGGFGTYAMGRALAALYARGVDYGPVNAALGSVVRRVRDAVSPAGGSDAGEVSS